MRERILRSALTRFSRDGFEATPLQAIADDLAVSVPTIRNYYGSKDGLLVATLGRIVGIVDQGVRGIVDQGLTDPAEAVALAVALGTRSAPLSRDLIAHVMRVAATEPGVGALMEDLRVSFHELITYAQEHAGGRTDVDPDRLAQVLADLILGAMVDWVHSPDADPKAHTEAVLWMAVDLVIPAHPTPAATAKTLESLVPAGGGGAGPSTRSELQERVLAVAHRRFAEHGVRETTVEAIAEEVGISALTIFYHFASKDGLIAALVTDVADAIDEATTEALERGEEDLREGIAIIPRRVGRLPRHGAKLTAEMLRVLLSQEEGRAAARRIHGAMAALVAEGQRRGLVRGDHGPGVLARIILDLCYGGILRWIQNPTRPTPEAALDTMRSVRILVEPR